MRRLRPLLLAFLLLPLLSGTAAAATLAFDREVRLGGPLASARVLGVSLLPEARPRPQVRLFAVIVRLLPSGRRVARAGILGPLPPPPAAEPLILPLPTAFPLFLGALGGLVLAGRRYRTPRLAARERPA